MAFGRWPIRSSVPRQSPHRTEVKRQGPALRISTARRKGNVGFQTLRRLPALVQAEDGQDAERKLTLLLALAPSSAGAFAEKKWKNNPMSIAGPKLAVMNGSKKERNE